MFKFPKDLIIFDVETSGTDETASIIQLGAVIFDRNGHLFRNGKEIYSFNEYIIPYTLTWDEEASKIHKIEKSFLYKKGLQLERALELFETWASPIWADLEKRYWLAQWSCGFDTNMLQNAYAFLRREYPFHYRSFDVASIVRFHLAKQGKLFMKCGEDKCARALGIEVKDIQLHDALYDAQLSGLMLEKITRENKCINRPS